MSNAPSSTWNPHRPLVATDIVLFTADESNRRVLLIRRGHAPFEGMHAFPGGLLDPDETLAQCALRELKEETDVDGVVLSELGSYSDPARDPRGRCISVAFIGVVDDDVAGRVKAGDDAAEAAFFVVDALTRDALAFDHWQILVDAKARLARGIR